MAVNMTVIVSMSMSIDPLPPSQRFLFESFDCYIALFYLAFFQFDVIRLRVELVGMYTTDSLRRVFLETIVPAALAWVSSLGKKDTMDNLKKSARASSGGGFESAAVEAYNRCKLHLTF